MIIAIDTETRGLDATKYLTGCLITERKPEKPEIYDKKEELWSRIIELGEAEAKRGKTLCVYAHNHQYDYYAYADLEDKNIKWFCEKPFIIAYTKEINGKKKEIIKFLDTMNIYPMSLSKMAEINGLKKSETPKILIEGKRIPSKKEMKKIKEYMINDTKIVLQTIINLKKKLSNEGIKVKRIYTISQIGINYLINYMQKNKEYNHVFWNKKTGEIKKTWKPETIHEAYRGGRVEALQTGKHKNCTTIDINSLYPDIATKIAFPDLNTERTKKEPKILEENEIGIAKVLIKNEKNKLGILPIRTPNGSYYPKKGKYLIGVWTIAEIKKACKEGYKLISIEWKQTWKEAPNNPLKEYMEKLYHLRKDSRDKHDEYFYKSMMNSAIGKLAQNKPETETIIDSVEKTEEYLEKNYKIIRGIEYNYAYKKELTIKPKKYYCPIIPTLITAYARIRLYDEMKKIPLQDLIYVDTDSITMKNFSKYTPKYHFGSDLGDFKIVTENKDCEIIGRKTYRIGDEIKASGIHKKEGQVKEWEQGILTDKKIKTIKTAKSKEEIGTFENQIRDLNQQKKNNQENQELLDDEKIYVDDTTTDITYFLPELQTIIND